MQHMLYPFATEQIVGKVDLHFSSCSSRFDLLLNPALAFRSATKSTLSLPVVVSVGEGMRVEHLVFVRRDKSN